MLGFVCSKCNKVMYAGNPPPFCERCGVRLELKVHRKEIIGPVIMGLVFWVAIVVTCVFVFGKNGATPGSPLAIVEGAIMIALLPAIIFFLYRWKN